MAIRIATVLPALVTLLLVAGNARAQDVADATRGKVVYERYCILCHGEKGDGKGHYSEDTTPVPRDFRQGTFKWRMTPSGSLPTDADLEKVLVTGLYGTSMSSLATTLSHQQRIDVVAYIKTFSPRFTNEKADPPIPNAPETPNTAASVERGETLYQVTLKCFQCHGATGNADGPSAATLRDDKDQPIVPYNFRRGSRFKCGSTNQDLYRIFMTGLDGTPMPSFADYLKPDQAWDLVHYLRKLQADGKTKPDVALASASGSK